MKTFDCKDIAALLSGYIDGELDAQTRHSADRHIAACETCRQSIDEAERLDTLIATESEFLHDGAVISEAFEATVLARTSVTDRLRIGRRRRTVLTGWLSAAAVVALGAIVWTSIRSATNQAEYTDIARLDTTMQSSPLWQSDVRREAMPSGAAGDAHRHIERPSEVRARHDATGDILHVSAVAATPAESSPAEAVSAMIGNLRQQSQLSDADAETLYATSLLFEMLANIDGSSFIEIDRVRRIAEYDEILPRLADVCERLPQRDRPLIVAAELMLSQIVDGPLSLEDTIAMRNTVIGARLTSQFEVLSQRSSEASSL